MKGILIMDKYQDYLEGLHTKQDANYTSKELYVKLQENFPELSENDIMKITAAFMYRLIVKADLLKIATLV